MRSELTKHVVACMNCEWKMTRKKFSSRTEHSFLKDAKNHCKETEHTVMVQT